MKKEISILMAAFALASCGTMSLTSSSGQRFSDGLYARPQAEDRQAAIAAANSTDALVEKTRGSEIYLSSSDTPVHRTDTLYIPENKSAVINFTNTGTSVTITDDPFDQVYLSIYPWTYYRPVTFRSIYWDPWYYGRYWGYYNPWYWDRWYYDPWYWGFGYAFDPWFHDPWYWGPAYRPWHHHYCGWYGGWGPGLGWHGPGHVHGGHGRDIYFGHRGSTGFHSTISASSPRNSHRSSSVTASGSRIPVNRRGIGTSSSIGRRDQTGMGSSTKGSAFSSSRRTVSASRSGIVSTGRLESRPSEGTVSTRPSSGTQTYAPATGSRRSVQSYRSTASSGTRASSAAAGQTNWRRPENSYGRSSSSSYGTNGQSSYNRSSARTSSSSSYNRSSSSFNRSTSSFNRQSSSSYNRGSSSISRSSSFSGSRSSGYSGGGRSGGGGSSSVRRR